MLTAFWSGLGGEFAKHWAARILTPAVAFWAGGLAAVWWSRHRGGVRRSGWAHELDATATALHSLSGIAQGLLLVGALLVVAASALAVEQLTLPLLRLLEGYWRRPRRLRDRLIARRRRRHQYWSTQVDELNRRQRFGALSVEEFFELGRLEATPPRDATRLRELRAKRLENVDARVTADLGRGRRYLHDSPASDRLGMPTRLGDILRAAERRSADKYGLDAVICWYALWSVLPAEIRTELTQARLVLDRQARAWLWGVLFLVWTPWTWWALPVGIVIPIAVYYLGMLASARLFGELTGTAFDLYRFRLYDGLHLPRPTSPVGERLREGPRLTNLLWGGLDEPGFSYVDTPAP